MSIVPASITALVLAGGKGRRLQGRDKGLVEVAGKPLISHVLARIAPQVGRVVISANRNQERYAALGFDVLTDTFDAGDYAGPLAGILAGLNACQTDWLLSIPCDTPCLPNDLVAQLIESVEQGDDMLSVHDGERLQPVIMLIHRSLTEELRTWLLQGNRAVKDWLATHSHSIVALQQPSAFRNLNTEDDLISFAQNLCN